jgi:hypothetical protein
MDKTWNLVSFGVHALLVSNIVVLLQGESCSISGMRTNRGTCEQPRSGAHARAYSRMTSGGSDSRSGDSSHRCPNRRTAHSLLRGGCLRIDAGLPISKLPAHGVIGDKNFEGLSRGGHYR